MSYIKNAIIRDLTIKGLEGGRVARLGDNITTVLSIDYFESIFEPVFEFAIRFVSREGVLSDIKLRGTENASIEISHDTGVLEFDDLVLTSFVQEESESTANTFSIRLSPKDLINNEKNRVNKRYDPKVNASTHVESILKSHVRTEFESDIEDTANSDGFFGNYWRPFRAIYWLARRSISKSMPEDGSGTDMVGFLFWMTKSGYKFKSIDTIMSGKKDSKKEFQQSEVVNPGNDNFNIHHPFFEYDQNILNQMQNSMYGEKRKYFNTNTLDWGVPELSLSGDEVKQASLGDEDRKLKINHDINATPTQRSVVLVDDGTMNMDGVIPAKGEGEYDPHKVITQARMRYQSLLSRSLRITVPYNLTLEAGDVIKTSLIKSLSGNDEWLSGYYIIKDLRHGIQMTESGIQCLTHLRLVRDTPGDA